MEYVFGKKDVQFFFPSYPDTLDRIANTSLIKNNKQRKSNTKKNYYKSNIN